MNKNQQQESATRISNKNQQQPTTINNNQQQQLPMCDTLAENIVKEVKADMYFLSCRLKLID
jgi:hypothetical protein